MEREQPIEPNIAEIMNDIGRIVADAIRECDPHYGFALFVFRFGHGDGHRINYISNATRADMLAALKEFIARAEGRYVEALVLEKSVLDNRPEIFVAVTSARIELAIDDMPLASPLFKPLLPFRDWTCWRHGRQITEAEAMPYLRASLGEDWNPPERA